MSLFSFLSFLHKLFPAKSVFAHCDAPCGIYTVESAKTAAMTVLKMVEKIQQLPLPNWSDAQAVQSYENSLSRFVHTKEEHAQKCKQELLILWTDYFKPEHLEMFPNLHETFWKAAKLCSMVKQEVNRETAIQLKAAVEEIADIFEKTHTAQH